MLRLVGILAWMSAGTALVPPQSGVFTYHNDNSRTGRNVGETVLVRAAVASDHFVKLFSHHVDGAVYAQPLYVAKLMIPGKGVHNVVFVATEADSLYAFDADAGTGSTAEPLWHISLIDTGHGASPGAMAVDAALDLGCAAIAPNVGITATPVIDPQRSAIYLEAFSREKGVLIHRLHAVDIRDGTEKRGSPVVVNAHVRRGGRTDIQFDPLRQLSRAALLLSNGAVYVTYGAHCDKPRYYGWMFAYDAATLKKKDVFVTAPVHGKAGIWMSGAGPAADSRGHVFLATGDGAFGTQAAPSVRDGSLPRNATKAVERQPADLGNTILEFGSRTDRLTLVDSFTPFDQARYARHDGDLGSGGVLLLPDETATPRLLFETGKFGTLYVLNREPLTTGNLHYCDGCESDRQILQEIPDAIPGGVWGMPAYWNDTVYASGSNDVLRAFSLRDGRLDRTPASVSREVCDYPGCGLSVSANGSEDGILWALQGRGLRAYDARDLGRALYSSDQHGARDDPGPITKFSIPTVFNGKVYVGGMEQLSVFGLN
jgi:hypothetical protein